MTSVTRVKLTTPVKTPDAASTSKLSMIETRANPLSDAIDGRDVATLPEKSDPFKIEPKPVNRLAEAGKTVAWTAPVGALSALGLDRVFNPETYNFPQLFSGKEYALVLNQLTDFFKTNGKHFEDSLGALVKNSYNLSSVGDKLKDQAIAALKPLQFNGVDNQTLDQLKQGIEGISSTDNNALLHFMKQPADVLTQLQAQAHQHAEPLVNATHGHMWAAAGLGALFTGVVGAGMSQLFANDKIHANQQIAELETKIAKDKVKKDTEKRLEELKKDKELKEKRQDIADIEAELREENA